MKPLLAHIYSDSRWDENTPCYVQPKLNGVRALYQNGHFQSRDEMPWNDGVLAHLAEPLKQIFDPFTILDGELYVHGWPLQRINGAIAINRKEPNEETVQVEYHIFDRVNYFLPFHERRLQLLEKVGLLIHPWIKLVPTMRSRTKSESDLHYSRFVANSYEGMMYRLGDCPYTKPSAGRGVSDKNNRTWHLLKRKDWQDDEFTIIDTEEGEGKRRNMVGALILETHAGKRFRSGTGLSDGEAVHMWEHSPVGRKAKIKFLVYSNDGIPMNSSILCIL